MSRPAAGYQFIFLARQEGLLLEEGLELIETTILNDSSKALAEGRVDAAAGLVHTDVTVVKMEENHF